MGMRICGVIVTHNPKQNILTQVLAAVVSQVETALIVDDGSTASSLEAIRTITDVPKTELLIIDQNLGLAHGQNKGLEWARERGFDSVLLLDQDSMANRDMVNHLEEALLELQAQGEKVAAVGPSLLDPRSQNGNRREKLIQFSNRDTRQKSKPHNTRWRAVDFVIASGSLIPLKALEGIGGMREDFFIDNVDLEWCFRALAAGFRLFEVPAAGMRHVIGDNIGAVWFVGRPFMLHNPIRLYYIMRNRILLYRLSHTPGQWIRRDWLRLMFKFFLFSLFFPPRWQNFRMMLTGIWHGISKHSGKY